MKNSVIRTAACVVAALVILATAAFSEPKKCTPIGGVILTDFGVPDANSTMGYATGDLKGSVGVTILGIETVGNNTLFHVQHHWVSESGDVIGVDPATATTVEVAPNMYAVVTYPVHLNGGTGRFAGATGDLVNTLGEADFVNGRLVFRYTGTLCTK